MRVIDIPQKTPAWLQWRAGGVSASDAAAVLGRSPYKTPWRLWAERTGLVAPEDLSNNVHVQRGNALEDQARRDFEDRHGTCLLPLCGESREHPTIRASFDGIDDDGCPVELKIPCDAVYQEVMEIREWSRAYQLYWVQLQSQLYVTEAERGWLVFYQRPGVVTEFEIVRQRAIPGRIPRPRTARFLGCAPAQARAAPETRSATSSSRPVRPWRPGPGWPASTASTRRKRPDPSAWRSRPRSPWTASRTSWSR